MCPRYFWVIRHLHISHNAPYLPPKFFISFGFKFSSDGCNTQEKWKTKVMHNFGGHTRSIMGDVPVAYPRCNIINSFSLLNGLLTGVGLRMFRFLCFLSGVNNKLYYTGDEPYFSTEIMPYSYFNISQWNKNESERYTCYSWFRKKWDQIKRETLISALENTGIITNHNMTAKSLKIIMTNGSYTKSTL